MSKKILKAFEKAVKIVGSKSELARQLSLSRQAVNDWDLLKIPSDHVIRIEQLTESQVTIKDLRPDLFK